jgi:alpha-L-fucosidase 2
MPAVMIKMLLYSEPGLIDLLPALPAQWPAGRVEGLPCRGQVLPRAIQDLTVQGGKAAGVGRGDDMRTLWLPAKQDVTLAITMV